MQKIELLTDLGKLSSLSLARFMQISHSEIKKRSKWQKTDEEVVKDNHSDR